MIVFTLYALLVWSAAFAGRRSWRGFAAALGGAALVLPAADPLVYVLWWALGEKPIWLFPFFYGYAGALALAGTMLACLPRRDELRPCENCGYELAGIRAGVCPECGEPLTRPATTPAGRRASAPRPAPPR